MNRAVLIAFGIILVLGVLGYISVRSAGKATNNPVTAVIPTQVSEITEINKSFDLDEQNESGETGRVVIIDQDGKTRVLLSIDNEPEDASQPAHIHSGQCPTPGAVKYALNNVVDGRSDTILDVAYSNLASQVPLAVNVHKSAAEIQAYVACGNLAF
jgi:hypothetical protein